MSDVVGFEGESHPVTLAVEYSDQATASANGTVGDFVTRLAWTPTCLGSACAITVETFWGRYAMEIPKLPCKAGSRSASTERTNHNWCRHRIRIEGMHLRRSRLAAVPCRDEVERIAGHEPWQEEVDSDGDPRGQPVETGAAEKERHVDSAPGTERHRGSGCRRCGTYRHIHMPPLRFSAPPTSPPGDWSCGRQRAR